MARDTSLLHPSAAALLPVLRLPVPLLVDETPLFKQVIECGIPETEGGVASLDWNRPGLGVELSTDATLFREVFCVGRGQVQ